MADFLFLQCFPFLLILWFPFVFDCFELSVPPGSSSGGWALQFEHLLVSVEIKVSAYLISVGWEGDNREFTLSAFPPPQLFGFRFGLLKKCVLFIKVSSNN